MTIDRQDVEDLASGYDPDPARSMSLRSAAYVDPRWLDVDMRAVFARTWQWICHGEKLRAPGSYVAATVAGAPIAVVRDRSGELRAFYNVCKHRAHELLSGSGVTGTIVCPYHAWVYDLDGSLRRARQTDRMPGFDRAEICLDRIAVEEFGGFVHVNLDSSAAPLAQQAPDLLAEIERWAPDVAGLTFAKRLTYDVKSDWCLLRYPGRGNFMVFQVIPAGPDRTLETWDFFFETAELEDAGTEAVRYIDEVLQQQDIAIVESVQRGMATPAFDQGRIVYDPDGSGLSEHGVHHFHGLILKAYEDFVR
jgi:phenylpropionate dioxygenase-like ring-hydroxylating dioxygenase large terminal subunit